MKTEEQINHILAENERRMERRSELSDYDPISGRGAYGDRVEVESPVDGMGKVSVPRQMTEDPGYQTCTINASAWERLRCRHDFEYWAWRCARIKHKTTAKIVPFVLNNAQRRVLGILERDRLASQPMRMILLKARQWGGSTLIQMYMAWIQSCIATNWHSLICAHVKDSAANIRGMYSSLLEHYPEDLWEGDDTPRFRPFERSQNIREIAGRGCRVSLGTSEKQDAIRGCDFAMAHLSETAYWNETRMRSPSDFIRAICSGIALAPNTLVVIESTANGTGNFFHSEWVRSESGQSDKHAVFVPWYEIDILALTPPDAKAFIQSWSAYEEKLWIEHHLCIDQIYWYRMKLREFGSVEKMASEFPTTPGEAFVNSGCGVFNSKHVERLREGCLAGERGEIRAGGKKFIPDNTGNFTLYEIPREDMRYIVAVDVGGRHDRSDWSVIAVLGVSRGGERRICGQWRGHTDHDILATKSCDIARYYNQALLVVESNTFETAEIGGVSDANMFILDRMAEQYGNLYRREVFDSLDRAVGYRIGFHTNRATKTMVISTLIEAVREGSYIERSSEACDELSTYQQLPNGSFAAKPGKHDDMLMTRAIALFVADKNYAFMAEVPPFVENFW